jgi:hypothetical protein
LPGGPAKPAFRAQTPSKPAYPAVLFGNLDTSVFLNLGVGLWLEKLNYKEGDFL